MRFPLQITLAAALVAAGCGREPAPAKSVPPPAPAGAGTTSPPPAAVAPAPVSPKPDEVTWGEAVNDLQIGIVFVGGYQERDCRRTAAVLGLTARYMTPPHEMPLVRALESAAADREARYEQGTLKVLHQEVAGGLTLSEALLKYSIPGGRELIEGVKAGEAAGELPAVLAKLSESFGAKGVPRSFFAEDEHFVPAVRLRNVGKKDISFPNHPAWLTRLELAGENTAPDVTCGPAPLNGATPRTFSLAAGAEIEFPMWSGLAKAFRDKPGGSRYAAGSNGFPPGKYSMTVVCAHPEHKDDACPHWHGQAVSPPVKIEVRPDAAKVAWGPLAEDMQLGLLLRGAAAEGGWARPRLCPNCTPRKQNDPAGVCRGCGRVTASAYQRFCEACAEAKSLCQGCGAAQPSGGTFVEGEPIEFEARFRNFGGADVVLHDAGHVSQWRFEFVPKSGGEKLIGHYNTGWKEDRRNFPVVVARRSVAACVLGIGPRCVFEISGEALSLTTTPKSFTCLPPGRYQMTATCNDAVLSLTAGPVEVEITPKVAAALSEDQIIARARAIGRQRWAEQMTHAPGTVIVFDEQPTVTRKGDTWTVVFQRGALQIAGSRAIVILDASGRELSTDCAFSPR